MPPNPERPKLQDPAMRIQMISVVCKLGPSAIEKLIPFLLDEDDKVREAAEQALNSIDPQWPQSDWARKCTPALEQALHDDNYWVGLNAAAVLKRIAGETQPESAPPVEARQTDKTTVTDRHYHDRREAARILASALKDSDAELRLTAAQGLGLLGNTGFSDALAAALCDRDEWVRWYAAQSLQATDWQPADDAQKAAFFVTLRCWEQATALGSIAVEPLLEALKTSHSKVREQAATALGTIKDNRAVGPLAALLEDRSRLVRKAAARALAAVGTQTLTPDQRQSFVREFGP